MTPPISPEPSTEANPSQSSSFSSRLAPRASRLFLNLRARLIVSHAFVILLALVLLLLFSAAYLRRYETTVEKARIEGLSKTLTISANFLARQAASSTKEQRIEAIDALADEQNVRLIVFGRAGQVLYDSDEANNLTGQVLADYGPTVRALIRQSDVGPGIVQHWIEPRNGDPLSGNLVLLSAGGPGAQGKALAIVVPPRRFPLLARYLPRLLLVAALSLAIASLAGYLLSRRIAAPVDRLTVAAGSMAEGHLEQEVAGEGPDELGRLVATFNTMSRRVAATARSQRDLLANVAHELRTPLTSVQGYAQALRDGVIEDQTERDRALSTIGREAERMASLIGQLLDLARLESGQTRLTLRPVPVTQLFDRVADRFQPLASQKGITMHVVGETGLAVQGDEGRLVQILSNLVDNAIRHTPGGGHVKIEATPNVARNDRTSPEIRLIVADTGEGIPPDRLTRIFDRFDRGASASTDRSGFGLGLAIVRELVALHHGTIRVSSELGRGTTFVVALPAAPSPRPGHPTLA
jgi:two-component system sensor histidine kinase BaeS